MTVSYLEPDRDLDYEEDIGAIKSSVRSRYTQGGGLSGDSDVGSSEEEEVAHERLLKAKSVSSAEQGGCDIQVCCHGNTMSNCTL